jgi:hypothetical protein
MKLVYTAAIGVVALLAAGVAAFYLYFDAIAGAAIEQGCTQALGVETDVGWVRIGLLSGVFRIGGLDIDNPAGFDTDHFLRLDRARFEVSLESLRGDTIVVPRIELDGIDVSIETVDGKTNYGVILAGPKNSEPSDAPAPESGSEGGKEFIVEELVVRNIVARLDLGAMAGKADRVEVEIPEILLRNAGSAGAGGATISEISRVVVMAVLTAVAKQGPTELAGKLLRDVGSLGNVTLEISTGLVDPKRSAQTAAKLGEGAAAAVEGAGKGAKDAVKRLGGLFDRSDSE